MGQLEDMVVETGSVEYWESRARRAEAKVETAERERDAADERHAHASDRLAVASRLTLDQIVTLLATTDDHSPRDEILEQARVVLERTRRVLAAREEEAL